MKLLTVILQSEDAPTAVDALVERGFRATQINTAGGFLQKSNTTLLLGVGDDQVDPALAVIRQNSRTRTELVCPAPLLDLGAATWFEPYEVQVGGATVFIIDVEQYVRL